MEFLCVNDWEQLPAGAQRLFARAERNSLFFSRRWLEVLSANALEEDQQLALACVLDGQSVLAILPLRAHESGNWHSLSTYYSSLYTLLLGDGQQQAILDCLAEGLARLDLQTLRLDPVAEDDAVLHGLQRAMAARGFDSDRVFRFVNWSHPLNGSTFAQYLAERPARLRNTIARKRRKLEREQGYEIRLTTGEDLDRTMTDYATIYKASWKGGERFPGFVPALVNTMAAAGWLRLAVLYIDGRPAAGQIWFVVHGKASIFRLAYDEAWQRYSPGSILTAFLMQQVIDTDGVESLDFLTGNEPYKQDWMSERRERSGLIMMRKHEPGTTPFARLRKWFAV